ncbi:MAG: ATP-binding region, ATPase domain protein [Nocardioides sp.]|nr:ATP-binding region, ATPase domain protein [Nocardioides sp.]
MGERRRRPRVGGVRLRTSAAATLVVALVLAAASIAFVLLQRQQLETSLENVARQQASAVAAQVAKEGAAVDLVGGGGDQSLIQVVDSSGSVVAASPSVEGEAPVVALRPAPGEVTAVSSDRLPIGEGAKFVVVARGVTGPDGPMVVLAAQSLETVQQSTSVVGRLLAIGYPLVLLAVGLTSYWLTGRALAPVEAIRRRVATIDGTSALSARVPVPPGGDEIARLAQTMNSMLTRLQTGSEAQQRFVGDASHELRSPLATIRAAHEIQSLHPESTDWPSVSAEVLSELDRVDRLVADLLLLARSDEHGLALQLREVDLDDLVRSEGARLQRAGVHDVVVSAPPVRVLGDPHHLARALRNLTDNAKRHAHRRVELRLDANATTAWIDVVDDGPGVPQDERERIFERFVRLDQSRARDSGGTGLGLPIARQVARAHGGDLVVTDDAAGARFTLSIPRVRPDSWDRS